MFHVVSLRAGRGGSAATGTPSSIAPHGSVLGQRYIGILERHNSFYVTILLWFHLLY
jgi:hypothetical protein